MKTARIIILAAAIAGALAAAPRYIGVAVATGTFWIDSAGVRNHATVFEGGTVEADKASVRIELTGGARVVLAAGARATVYEHHMRLEKGRGQMESAADYQLDAGSLSMTMAANDSQAVVSIDGAAVEVAALRGEARVANAEGVVVANVETGHTVALHLERDRNASVLTGCVSRARRAYMMRDEVSSVTVELRGAEMNGRVGKRVEVTGAIVPASRGARPAAQVMQVATVRVLESGCGTTIAGGRTGSASRQAPSTQDGAAGQGAGADDPASTASGATTPAATTPAATAPAPAATVTVAGASAAHIAIIAGVVVAAVGGTVAGVVVANQSSAPVSPGR